MLTFPSPHQAIGETELGKAFDCKPLDGLHCFNITHTIHYVREHSKYHPIHKFGINGKGTTLEDDLEIRSVTPKLELEEEGEETTPPDLPYKRPQLNRFRIAPEIDTLKHILNIPLRLRPETWKAAHTGSLEKRLDLEKQACIPPTDEYVSNCRDPAPLPPGIAILRSYNHDLELIPPNHDMLSTFFWRLVRQDLGRLRDRLNHYDRLNMMAFIPELSLVVVASQIGRAALITLTRLKDGFYRKSAPVVMFRLDLILPLKKDEDAHRPNIPLAGLAVAPLQSAKKIEPGKRRYRLIMHYADHTVLSYELFRDENSGMVVL